MKGGGLLTKKRQKSKKEKDISVERKSRGLGRGRRRDHLLALVAGGERGHGGHQSLKGGSGVMAALHEVGFRGGGGTQAFTRIFYHIGLLIGRRVAKAWNYFWPKTIIVFYL